MDSVADVVVADGISQEMLCENHGRSKSFWNLEAAETALRDYY